MKAIIIGGGIGGLTAAIALREHFEVEVFEQAAALREVGAGITLWSNAIVALDQIGAADTVLSISSPPMRTGIVRNWQGRQLGAITTDRVVRSTGMPTVVVHRAELITALESHFGGTIHTGCRFESFVQDNSGVEVRFENGRVARGDVLIGADGIHSLVRQQIHGNQHPRYAGYLAWRGITDFKFPSYADDQWQVALGPGSHFGYMPIDHERTFWFGTMNAPRPDVPRDAKAAALDFFGRWHAPLPTVIDTTPAEHVLCNAIIDRPPLRRWGIGRVTLLGDSAHPVTPNLGQGACQAIEDAVLLARALSTGSRAEVDASLRKYENGRIPRTRSINHESLRAGRMLQLENTVARGIRDWMLRMTLGTRLDNGMKYAHHVI